LVLPNWTLKETATLTPLTCGSAGCLKGADVVFALDASGSIMFSNFQLMLNFVAMIVQSLDIDSSSNGASVSRVGLVTFGDYAQLQFNLNQYTTKSSLLQALNVPYAAGKTNTADAIRWVSVIRRTKAFSKQSQSYGLKPPK
jgi:uncharacterized protein YegL